MKKIINANELNDSELSKYEQLIHESYIDEFIQDEIMESFDIPDWLFNYINWDELINTVLCDYVMVTYEDENYFAR